MSLMYVPILINTDIVDVLRLHRRIIDQEILSPTRAKSLAHTRYSIDGRPAINSYGQTILPCTKPCVTRRMLGRRDCYWAPY